MKKWHFFAVGIGIVLLTIAFKQYAVFGLLLCSLFMVFVANKNQKREVVDYREVITQIKLALFLSAVSFCLPFVVIYLFAEYPSQTTPSITLLLASGTLLLLVVIIIYWLYLNDIKIQEGSNEFADNQLRHVKKATIIMASFGFLSHVFFLFFIF